MTTARSSRRSTIRWRTSKPSPIGWCTVALCRSEEHTSELQSQSNLVCRLLLEKKKNKSHRSLSLGTASNDIKPHSHIKSRLLFIAKVLPPISSCLALTCTLHHYVIAPSLIADT